MEKCCLFTYIVQCSLIKMSGGMLKTLYAAKQQDAITSA